MEISQKDQLWWLLSDIEGLGARGAAALKEAFGSIEAIWQASDDELKEAGARVKTRKTICQGPDLLRADREIERFRAMGIGIISLDHPMYPELLKKIFDPPMVLYTRGDPSLFHTPMMAVVGSRNSTAYGDQAARQIGAGLARNGITVVSGMAYGIDSAAHSGALQAGGMTIAVLGCGVDVCYPRSHMSLYHSIIQNGLIISEYPPGEQPRAGYFPQRNRIISGLCKGVIVVEAGVRSGSLITADQALDQNRDVYAVPGPIFSDMSYGTNHLIAEGAQILYDLSLLPNEASGLRPVRQYEGLSGAEQKLLKSLQGMGKDMSSLIAEFGSVEEVIEILSLLEIKGLVMQGKDGRYSLR